MTLKNSQHRYGRVSIALHWFMLLLLIAVYTCIELREFFPRGSDIREGLKSWHFMLGLSVLTLVVIRLGWRLLNTYPKITPPPPTWQRYVSHSVHGALYLFMLAMPVAGWLILSGEAEQIPFWGLELPPLMGPNEALAEDIEEIHKLVGTIGYWLIGFHAAAALFHHYWVKDDTLQRMLPWAKERNQRR